MRFGLIGHPVAGSVSPAVFARAYGGRWPYDLIEGADFELSWQRFLSDYRAINITAPFKELAFARVGSVAEDCRAIGAINIAVKTPEGIKGYNSDYLGVRKVLEDSGFGPGRKAVVAGFGGAGKAVYAAAVSLGMDTVVCNRTPKELSVGSNRPGGSFPAETAKGFWEKQSLPGTAALQTRPLEELPDLAAAADILIYTLPVPMAGISCPVVLEANYKTPGMEYSATERYIPGNVWHLEQARTGYALMTGVEPAL